MSEGTFVKISTKHHVYPSSVLQLMDFKGFFDPVILTSQHPYRANRPTSQPSQESTEIRATKKNIPPRSGKKQPTKHLGKNIPPAFSWMKYIEIYFLEKNKK